MSTTHKSRRITFSEFEIKQIVAGLKKLQNEPAINYQVTEAGKELYQTIIDKLMPLETVPPVVVKGKKAGNDK